MTVNTTTVLRALCAMRRAPGHAHTRTGNLCTLDECENEQQGLNLTSQVFNLILDKKGPNNNNKKNRSDIVSLITEGTGMPKSNTKCRLTVLENTDIPKHVSRPTGISGWSQAQFSFVC